MFSVCVEKPGRVRVIDIPKPVPGHYQAIVKTEAAYFCNRTDLKIIEGNFPGMKNYPILLGHETVGKVEQIGERVRSFSVGERAIGGFVLDPPDPKYVSAWGGFSEYVIVNDHQAMANDGLADEVHGWKDLYQIQKKVPSDISIEAAGLIYSWREVYGAIEDFHLQERNDILIFGAGPVGLSFVKFSKIRGLGFVGIVDPHPEKREIALRMGADITFSPDDEKLIHIGEIHEKQLDAVIDAVGKDYIINFSLPMIKEGGSICVYGVLSEPRLVIDKEKGPYNFNLILHQVPTRDREASAHDPICGLIKKGILKPDEFISAEFPIFEIQKAIELAKTSRAIKILLRF